MFSVILTPGLSNYLSGVDERGKKIDILKICNNYGNNIIILYLLENMFH